MTAAASPTIGLRHALAADMDYIEATWLRAFVADGIGIGGMDREVLFRFHRQVIRRLMRQHTTVVAYDPSDSRVILGFVCGDDYPSAAVIHFAYVRRRLRLKGIARAMMEHLGWTPGKPIMGTHQTFSSKTMQGRMALLYNPYLQREEFAGGLRGRTTLGLEDSQDPNDSDGGDGE